MLISCSASPLFYSKPKSYQICNPESRSGGDPRDRGLPPSAAHGRRDGTLCPEDGQGKYVQTEERTISFGSKYPCLSGISEAVEMVGGQGSLLAARVGTLASYERTLQTALAMS